MGRRNRRQPQPSSAPTAGLNRRVEQAADGDWVVQSVTGSAATKPYRCPGCDHEIRPATPHVVTWPDGPEAAIDDRRHWHTICWRERLNRH